LNGLQSTKGWNQLKREREQAVSRFAKTLVESERLSPTNAQRRAQDTLGQLWAEQDRRVDEERQALRVELAGKPPSD
jgi:hypothetical protein